jgi:hypothetical protein
VIVSNKGKFKETELFVTGFNTIGNFNLARKGGRKETA